MAYNNFQNAIPFKWPWASQTVQAPQQPVNYVGRSAFTFPSNMAQQTQDEPGPAFSQPQEGEKRGPRQFAPSFGASSGGGSHLKAASYVW